MPGKIFRKNSDSPHLTYQSADSWGLGASAPGFFAKAEMGSIRFQRRKIFLAVIAFGGPRSSCSGRGAQLPFGTLCATGLRK
jgi:hypothetical protein